MAERAGILWMAGFFDGEGYVGLQVCKGGPGSTLPCVKLRISVSNTDVRAFAPFIETFGGTKVRSWQGRPGNKIVYRWDLTGRRACEFLKAIRPHLIVKADQVELAIRFWELPWRGIGKGSARPATGGASRDDSQIATDLDLARQMRAMKRA